MCSNSCVLNCFQRIDSASPVQSTPDLQLKRSSASAGPGHDYDKVFHAETMVTRTLVAAAQTKRHNYGGHKSSWTEGHSDIEVKVTGARLHETAPLNDIRSRGRTESELKPVETGPHWFLPPDDLCYNLADKSEAAGEDEDTFYDAQEALLPDRVMTDATSSLFNTVTYTCAEQASSSLQWRGPIVNNSVKYNFFEQAGNESAIDDHKVEIEEKVMESENTRNDLKFGITLCSVDMVGSDTDTKTDKTRNIRTEAAIKQISETKVAKAVQNSEISVVDNREVGGTEDLVETGVSFVDREVGETKDLGETEVSFVDNREVGETKNLVETEVSFVDKEVGETKDLGETGDSVVGNREVGGETKDLDETGGSVDNREVGETKDRGKEARNANDSVGILEKDDVSVRGARPKIDHHLETKQNSSRSDEYVKVKEIYKNVMPEGIDVLNRKPNNADVSSSGENDSPPPKGARGANEGASVSFMGTALSKHLNTAVEDPDDRTKEVFKVEDETGSPEVLEVNPVVDSDSWEEICMHDSIFFVETIPQSCLSLGEEIQAAMEKESFHYGTSQIGVPPGDDNSLMHDTDTHINDSLFKSEDKISGAENDAESPGYMMQMSNMDEENNTMNQNPNLKLNEIQGENLASLVAEDTNPSELPSLVGTESKKSKNQTSRDLNAESIIIPSTPVKELGQLNIEVQDEEGICVDIPNVQEEDIAKAILQRLGEELLEKHRPEDHDTDHEEGNEEHRMEDQDEDHEEGKEEQDTEDQDKDREEGNEEDREEHSVEPPPLLQTSSRSENRSVDYSSRVAGATLHTNSPHESSLGEENTELVPEDTNVLIIPEEFGLCQSAPAVNVTEVSEHSQNGQGLSESKRQTLEFSETVSIDGVTSLMSIPQFQTKPDVAHGRGKETTQYREEKKQYSDVIDQFMTCQSCPELQAKEMLHDPSVESLTEQADKKKHEETWGKVGIISGSDPLTAANEGVSPTSYGTFNQNLNRRVGEMMEESFDADLGQACSADHVKPSSPRDPSEVDSHNEANKENLDQSFANKENLDQSFLQLSSTVLPDDVRDNNVIGIVTNLEDEDVPYIDHVIEDRQPRAEPRPGLKKGTSVSDLFYPEWMKPQFENDTLADKTDKTEKSEVRLQLSKEAGYNVPCLNLTEGQFPGAAVPQYETMFMETSSHSSLFQQRDLIEHSMQQRKEDPVQPNVKEKKKDHIVSSVGSESGNTPEGFSCKQDLSGSSMPAWKSMVKSVSSTAESDTIEGYMGILFSDMEEDTHVSRQVSIEGHSEQMNNDPPSCFTSAPRPVVQGSSLSSTLFSQPTEESAPGVRGRNWTAAGKASLTDAPDSEQSDSLLVKDEIQGPLTTTLEPTLCTTQYEALDIKSVTLNSAKISAEPENKQTPTFVKRLIPAALTPTEDVAPKLDTQGQANGDASNKAHEVINPDSTASSSGLNSTLYVKNLTSLPQSSQNYARESFPLIEAELSLPSVSPVSFSTVQQLDEPVSSWDKGQEPLQEELAPPVLTSTSICTTCSSDTSDEPAQNPTEGNVPQDNDPSVSTSGEKEGYSLMQDLEGSCISGPLFAGGLDNPDQQNHSRGRNAPEGPLTGEAKELLIDILSQTSAESRKDEDKLEESFGYIPEKSFSDSQGNLLTSEAKEGDNRISNSIKEELEKSHGLTAPVFISDKSNDGMDDKLLANFECSPNSVLVPSLGSTHDVLHRTEKNQSALPDEPALCQHTARDSESSSTCTHPGHKARVQRLLSDTAMPHTDHFLWGSAEPTNTADGMVVCDICGTSLEYDASTVSLLRHGNSIQDDLRSTEHPELDLGQEPHEEKTGKYDIQKSEGIILTRGSNRGDSIKPTSDLLQKSRIWKSIDDAARQPNTATASGMSEIDMARRKRRKSSVSEVRKIMFTNSEITQNIQLSTPLKRSSSSVNQNSEKDLENGDTEASVTKVRVIDAYMTLSEDRKAREGGRSLPCPVPQTIIKSEELEPDTSGDKFRTLTAERKSSLSSEIIKEEPMHYLFKTGALSPGQKQEKFISQSNDQEVPFGEIQEHSHSKDVQHRMEVQVNQEIIENDYVTMEGQSTSTDCAMSHRVLNTGSQKEAYHDLACLPAETRTSEEASERPGPVNHAERDQVYVDDIIIVGGEEGVLNAKLASGETLSASDESSEESVSEKTVVSVSFSGEWTGSQIFDEPDGKCARQEQVLIVPSGKSDDMEGEEQGDQHSPSIESPGSREQASALEICTKVIDGAHKIEASADWELSSSVENDLSRDSGTYNTGGGFESDNNGMTKSSEGITCPQPVALSDFHSGMSSRSQDPLGKRSSDIKLDGDVSSFYVSKVDPSLKAVSVDKLGSGATAETTREVISRSSSEESGNHAVIKPLFESTLTDFLVNPDGPQPLPVEGEALQRHPCPIPGESLRETSLDAITKSLMNHRADMLLAETTENDREVSNDSCVAITSGDLLEDDPPSITCGSQVTLPGSYDGRVAEWLSLQPTGLRDYDRLADCTPYSSIWSDGSSSSDCRDLIDACRGEESVDIMVTLENGAEDVTGTKRDTDAKDLNSFGVAGHLDSQDLNTGVVNFESEDADSKAEDTQEPLHTDSSAYLGLSDNDPKDKPFTDTIHSKVRWPEHYGPLRFEAEDNQNPELVSSNVNDKEYKQALKGCDVSHSSMTDAYFKNEPAYVDQAAKEVALARDIVHLSPKYSTYHERTPSSSDVDMDISYGSDLGGDWTEQSGGYEPGRHMETIYSFDGRHPGEMPEGELDSNECLDDSLDESDVEGTLLHTRTLECSDSSEELGGFPGESTRHCSLYDEFQDMLEEAYGSASTAATSYATAVADLSHLDEDFELSDSLEDLRMGYTGTYRRTPAPCPSPSGISQDSLNGQEVETDEITIYQSRGGGEINYDGSSSFTDDSIDDQASSDERVAPAAEESKQDIDTELNTEPNVNVPDQFKGKEGEARNWTPLPDANKEFTRKMDGDSSNDCQ